MEHQDKDKLAKSKGNAVKAFVSCALIGGVVGVSSLVATAAGGEHVVRACYGTVDAC